jgi:cbb3-type cytochrome oxidase cytochrome c subunit
MINVNSVTNNYQLQPVLIEKHKRTLDWLSTLMLMKSEIRFFQSLLDKNAAHFSDAESKKKIDHFQSLIIYYRDEMIDSARTKVRLHEKKLAEMLETKDETSVSYFKEHDGLMAELDSLYKQFIIYKEELLDFIGETIK